MTFGDLKALSYEATGYGTSPPTPVATRIGDWVNEGYRKLLREPGMVDLRQGTLPFSSVINQTTYAIPQIFEQIQAIVQQTNDRRLRLMSRDMYRMVDPAERSVGLPEFWVPEGFQPVYQQPAATPLYVSSSAAGDTTQTLTVSGARANGDSSAPVNATLNGVAFVQVGTFTDWQKIETLSLSATCVGVVTLSSDNAGAVPLARIPIGRKSVLYDVIRLWPTAQAVLTYQVDGLYLIPSLVNDWDTPIFPESYHDVLYCYAKMKEYERTGSDRFTVAQQDYVDGQKKLLAYIQFGPDYRPISGTRDTTIRRSSLGGFFPSDYGWP